MGMGFAPTWLRQESPLLHKNKLRNPLFPHVCYRTKFRSFRSHSLGVGRGLKKLGAPGPRSPEMCTWLTPRNVLLPPVLPCQIRSFCIKPYERNYGDMPENLIFHVPTFKVTQGRWI